MINEINLKSHKVNMDARPDGSTIMSSAYDLGPVADKTGDWLHHWAAEAPDRTFIAERSGAGWREESYAATLQKVQALASSLLGRGMGPDTPILIMSGNGVDHGLLSLAAQYIGAPTVPIAEQYSLIPDAHHRLRHAVDLVKPAMAYVVDARDYGDALTVEELAGVEIVASRNAADGMTRFDELLQGDAGADIAARYAEIGPDTVAKILLTSGSTSNPKGVMTTQRMMCTNQTQIADALPFLRDRPPRIMDWLPWNHVFGGSHNFNMMLSNGGSFYIDDGKPVKHLFDRTLENLSMVAGTLAFNVPMGFGMLLKALEKDKILRQKFFGELDLIFYAGASLPQEIWQGFERMAMEVQGRLPLLTSSWGLTETAPACLMQHERCEGAGQVGVPLSAVEAKLLPTDDNRFEIRVRGPNIMPGYFEDAAKTRDAFDDEGFFITGDAVAMVDPDAPEKGLRFDGRISDDFKLLTGTWVRATALRIDVLAWLAPLASDIVITGHDRNEIGIFIFPDRGALADAGFDPHDDGQVLDDALLRGEIHKRLAEHAAHSSGSSTRVARALVMAEPPSLKAGEITAKGNLNNRKVLTERADILARLYDDADPAVIKI